MIIYFCTGIDRRLHENYNLAKMVQTTFKMHWVNFKVLISFPFRTKVCVRLANKITEQHLSWPPLLIQLAKEILSKFDCQKSQQNQKLMHSFWKLYFRGKKIVFALTRPVFWRHLLKDFLNTHRAHFESLTSLFWKIKYWANYFASHKTDEQHFTSESTKCYLIWIKMTELNF